MSDEKGESSSTTNINTEGGTFIEGNIVAGDFIGRDKIVITEEVAYDVRGLANPYLGLAAFSYSDQAKYGGRENEIAVACAKLTDPASPQAVMFITGASGSGKSSFAQAGLIPALEAHYAGLNVKHAVFRPTRNPMAGLSNALFELLDMPKQNAMVAMPEELINHLLRHPRREQINLIVIDQFEELFAQAESDSRNALLKFLTNLPPFLHTRTHVIITLRSDYLVELFKVPALYETAKASSVELRTMSEDELRWAIEKPVRATYASKRKRFDPSLVEQLAMDAAEDATHLPLLQVTLSELWIKGRLVRGNYTNLGEAIEKQANQLFHFADYPNCHLPRSEVEKHEVLNIFLDLIAVSPGGDHKRDLRLSRPIDQIARDEPRQAIVRDLIQARLLSVTAGEDEPTIQIAHELLIQQWQTLREAINARRNVLRQRTRFEELLQEWLEHGKSDDFLLSKGHLDQALELHASNDISLKSPIAQEFLKQSIILNGEQQNPRVQTDEFQGSEQFVAEVKLILVGDGNVGKTSLVNRLIFGIFKEGQAITEGVAVRRWGLTTPRADAPLVRINTWDFGGQGHMHATHSYFFSRRSVYVLVLNAREDDRGYRAEYWLRLIRMYGGDSPVVVVINRIDENPASRIDEYTLQMRHNQIVDFVRTSCKTGEGIDILRRAIIHAITDLDRVGLRYADDFIKLKNRIEQQQHDSPHGESNNVIALEDYYELCEESGVDHNRRDLYLTYLNDLGAMLYFGDEYGLEQTAVVNPHWITAGIYKVINDHDIAQKQGRFRMEDIRRTLPPRDYPVSQHRWLLGIMRKFELCAELDDRETLFLLPGLLPARRPELPPFDFDSALKLQYEYPVWLDFVFTRLIAKMRSFLLPDAYWRTGVMFRSRDRKSTALVIAYPTERRLIVGVQGDQQGRRSFLNLIRDELGVIHAGLSDSDLKEVVITKAGGEISYSLLVKLEERGQTTHVVEVGDEIVELDVTELLEGVRAEPIPNEGILKNLIVERFNLDELQELCSRLDVNFESISGEPTIDSKSRNLIVYAKRRGLLPKLMAELRESRPNMRWA